MRSHSRFLSAILSLSFLALASTACSESTSSTDEPEAKGEAASGGSSAEAGGENQTDEQPSGLLLDFTAYIEGAIQVSGVSIERETGLTALVTDHERVILFDLLNQESRGDFSVQYGDLPRQGASEAVAFGANSEVYVLYPDFHELRGYDQDGTLVHSVSLPESKWFGGLAIDLETEHAIVVRELEDGMELVAIDLDDDAVGFSVGISGDLIGEQIEGLSLTTSGSAESLWVVSKTSGVFQLDPMTGQSQKVGQADAVADASAIEAFVNMVDGGEEENLAIADDDNQYNEVPGPLRLYLLE